MPKPRKLPPIEVVVELLRRGETVREVAEKFGAASATVYHSLRRAGYTPEDWANRVEVEDEPPVS